MKLHISRHVLLFLIPVLLQSGMLKASAESYPYQKQMEEVITLINQERAAQGIASVTEKAELDEAANIRAQELLQDYNHLRPDGRRFYTVLEDQDIFYMTAAENIAWGQTSPEEVMNDWMTSTKGHKENILNVNVDAVGIGIASQGSTLYWVQIFTGGSDLPDLVYSFGDINNDQYVNAHDASLLLKHIADEGSGKKGFLSPKQLACADLNQNDRPDGADAAKILAYAAYFGVNGSKTIEEYYHLS